MINKRALPGMLSAFFILISMGVGFGLCTPNWVCGDWNACTPAGTQNRTCTDTNSCSDPYIRIDRIDCTYTPPTAPAAPTGGVIGANESSGLNIIYALVAIGIVGAGFIGYRFVYKKK